MHELIHQQLQAFFNQQWAAAVSSGVYQRALDKVYPVHKRQVFEQLLLLLLCARLFRVQVILLVMVESITARPNTD
jgi:hypothetical protein